MTSFNPASTDTPPIPGLYVFPNLLPVQTERNLVKFFTENNTFRSGQKDQGMFFSSPQPQPRSPSGRSIPNPTSDEPLIRNARERSFPTPLRRLHEQLALLLENRLEREVWRRCFDEHYHPPVPPRRPLGETEERYPQAKAEGEGEGEGEGRRLQSIINLYPGPSASSRARERAGITPHVDLVGRYGDGIVGVCLLAGVVMDFRRVPVDGTGQGGQGGGRDDERLGDVDGEDDKDSLFNSDSDSDSCSAEEPTTYPSQTNPTTHHPVYLPARTIYLLTGPARYQWTHGIDPRSGDWILFPPASSVSSSSSSPSPSTAPSAPHLAGRTENEKRYVLRDTRISVTFRWMKKGAEVLGEH